MENKTNMENGTMANKEYYKIPEEQLIQNQQELGITPTTPTVSIEEHSPFEHNVDVLHIGACTKCGGTEIISTPTNNT